MASQIAPNNEHVAKVQYPRISWGAIFAAVVVALAIQVLLGMLGTAIGASTLDPATVDGSPSASSFGIGAAIWWVVSSLIALYVAGWIAGHLSGNARKSDAVLHGLAAWAVATIVTLYLVTSAAGSVMSGATAALGKVAEVSAQGVAAVAPSVKNAVQDAAGNAGFSFDDLKNQARTLLAQSGKPGLQPGAMGQSAKDALNNAQTPDAAGNQDIGSMLDKLFANGKAATSQVDRDAVVNVVMQRTGKSRPEAEQQVAAWETSYQQSKAKFDEAKQQAAAKARQVADATAKAVSRAALLAFIASLLGAVAAMLGASRSSGRYLVDQNLHVTR